MGHSTTSRDGGGSRFGGFSPQGDAEMESVASSRSRGRLVLRGQLDEVGFDALLSSLSGRGKSCIVEVRSPSRRGEVVLTRGQIKSAWVDTQPREGLSKDADIESALLAMRGFYNALFDVLSLDDVAGPVSRSPESLQVKRQSSRPPPPLMDDDATDVALAAAVMNACGAYTRKWLGSKAATSVMLGAWTRVSASTPALDAFRISSDGMVSVSGIERAKGAIPRAVATWVFAVFDAAAMANPSRFGRYFIPEMLGGLSRLLEKGGFSEAFRDGGSR